MTNELLAEISILKEKLAQVKKERDDALYKAEKYKWHDLRKNPDDLPRISERVLVLNIEYNTNIDWLDIFNSDIKDWKFARREIIAWKYIEPFEEVEE